MNDGREHTETVNKDTGREHTETRITFFRREQKQSTRITRTEV